MYDYFWYFQEIWFEQVTVYSNNDCEEQDMINEEKVKIMTKLAMYEQGKGRKYLPVSKYYRSDYIGLALIKNFFLVTIGYCLSVAAVAVYFGEYLLGEYTQNESDNARCIYCDRLSDRTCGIFSPDVYTVLGSVLSGKKECQRILQSAY